jgi:DNA-binding transcriptional ArsR family regulator
MPHHGEAPADADARARRAAIHRALADEHRLAIIDLLWRSDATPAELQAATGLRSNLLAFHLRALEDAGLISRHASHGDRRRRYAALEPAAVPHVGHVAPVMTACVLFVCTHNAARSQMAAALWQDRGMGDAASAGTMPAARVSHCRCGRRRPRSGPVCGPAHAHRRDQRPSRSGRVGV